MTVGTYFEKKPEIEIPSDAVLSFSCMKNELPRLAFFLDYYRAAGVHTFFIVDNNSTDGSYEYLLTQPDVVAFRSTDSYKGSGAGRDLVHELCAHYGIGHWCLTLDVDELLYYPGAEHVSLPTLCEYLDAEQAEGLFTVFLDLYSDKPVSSTLYESGTDFTATCPFYETDSYLLGISAEAPFISVFGGPRWRVFWNADSRRRGPAMRKVPLVKWKEGFRYLYSTHSHTDIQLATITGVLAHFKFFSFFTNRVDADNTIGDRRQSADYERYQTTLNEDPSFLNPSSKRFTGSQDFCRDGLMAVSTSYREFVEPIFASARVNAASHMPQPSSVGVFGQSESSFTISAMAHLWPFVMAGRLATERMSRSIKQANPEHRVRVAAENMGIEWFNEREICFLIPEQSWSESRRFRASIAIKSATGDVLATITPADLTRVANSTVPNLYRTTTPACLGPESDLDRTGLDITLSFSSDWFVTVQSNIANSVSFDHSGFNGAIERIEDASVTAWVRDATSGSWWNPVCFFADGFYLGRANPIHERRDLGKRGETARASKFTIPLGFLHHQPKPDAPIEVRSAMGDFELLGSPLVVGDETVTTDLSQALKLTATQRSILGSGKSLAEKVVPRQFLPQLKDLARKL